MLSRFFTLPFYKSFRTYLSDPILPLPPILALTSYRCSLPFISTLIHRLSVPMQRSQANLWHCPKYLGQFSCYCRFRCNIFCHINNTNILNGNTKKHCLLKLSFVPDFNLLLYFDAPIIQQLAQVFILETYELRLFGRTVERNNWMRISQMLKQRYVDIFKTPDLTDTDQNSFP